MRYDIIRSVTARVHRPVRTGWIFTRHGALMAARSMQVARVRTPLQRLLLVLVGSTVIGLGVSLFIHARLGLPPFDVLLSAIASNTGLSHGQAGWVTSGTLLVIASVLGRRPSIYGVVFILVNGASVDIWSQLLVDPSGLGVRLIFVVLGVAGVAGGVAIVAHSSSTGGPFELLTGAASDRGVNQTLSRSVLELGTVGLGVALGGQLGIGTLVFVLGIGPAISIAVQALADREIGRGQRLEMAKQG